MIRKILNMGLVPQIIIGLIVGILIGVVAPQYSPAVGVLGTLFVQGLKAVAPILVFFLVMTAIASSRGASAGKSIRPVLAMYLIGTLLAAFIAVVASFAFPTKLTLLAAVDNAAPESLSQVFSTILGKFFANPVTALAESNFLGILTWAILIGYFLRGAAETTKATVHDIADGVTKVVRLVIRFAPLGIMGLVTQTVASQGLDGLSSYAHLLIVLVGAMLFVALVANPIMVGVVTKTNPYPLVLTCLRESGITAFFTRSSAANIPVNLTLAKKLDVHEDLYSVSIPLGATVNMAGAAITITVLTLAAAHTVGIEVGLAQALLLSIVAAFAACGASGVAGGSLLLIPLACSLFGINADVAMQVVAIGFVVGVVQDSCETALNSSTDVLFTTAIDRRA